MFIHVFRRKKMKSSSLILMGIAVVAVGMFALPSTVSLFSGQHQWYYLGGYSSDTKLPCKKCHADVYEEYLQTDAHWTLSSSGTDPDKACYACHRANNSITYATGTDARGGQSATPGKQAHAASTVACMLCHQYGASSNVSTTAGPYAGGFPDFSSCLLYTSPSPRDLSTSRMPSSA